MINTNISKDSRGKGKCFHKQPYGTGASKTKLIASRDITTECGEGKLYSINYLKYESIILQMIKYKNKYYQIQ